MFISWLANPQKEALHIVGWLIAGQLVTEDRFPKNWSRSVNSSSQLISLYLDVCQLAIMTDVPWNTTDMNEPGQLEYSSLKPYRYMHKLM